MATIETLQDVLTRYAREVTPTKRGADPESVRLAAMARRSIAALPLRAVTSMQIAAYRDARLREVRPATVNRELILLAHALEVARREWGVVLPVNPCRLVRHARAPRGRDRRLVDDEEARLLLACRSARNSWLAPLVELALATAMRRGELLSLEWRYVRLERRIAFLPLTKNGEARTVPLSRAAVAALGALAGAEDLPAGRVFPGVTGSAVRQSFERAVRRAGLADLRFHDLRHEATSRLFERGLNVMEVAAITGHRTLAMLQRYTHLRAEELVARLDRT